MTKQNLSAKMYLDLHSINQHRMLNLQQGNGKIPFEISKTLKPSSAS